MRCDEVTGLPTAAGVRFQSLSGFLMRCDVRGEVLECRLSICV